MIFKGRPVNGVEYEPSRVREKRLTQRRHASYIFIDDHFQLSKVSLPPVHPGSLHLGNLQQLMSSDDYLLQQDTK